MAATHLSCIASSMSTKGFTSFEGLKASNFVIKSPFSALKDRGISLRYYRGFVVNAATTVMPKVAVAEEKTEGGLFLTDAIKEKPSIGTVIAVGPGPFDDEGNRKALSVAPGNTVLYSKYAGNDFKGSDGSDYITLRATDVMAILS